MKPDSKTLTGTIAALVLATFLVGSTMAYVPGDERMGSVAEAHIAGFDPGRGHEALLAKADETLADRIQQGQTEAFDAILTGHPHQGVTVHTHADRAAAMRELDLRAAPFFGVVQDVTGLLGGTVVGSWSAAPAIKVHGDLELLQVLALLDEVQHVALDYEGVVGLYADDNLIVDPIPEDGAETSNTQGRNMIQAEEIWGAGFMGEGITIAIIDTGIDGTHEAFKNADGSSRIVGWANCVAGDGTPESCDTSGAPFDDQGHGTHVAGTAAGSDLWDDPAAFEEVGVAPRADLMGVKFLNSGGGGSFEGALSALQWSFDNGADLTSNSWGASSCNSGLNVIQLVNQLNDLGMANVFAAGNSGFSGVGSPACAEKAIAVGAVDGSKNIASFSSRGPCSDPTEDDGTRTCPHVVAKGVNVRSSVPRGSCSLCHPTGYITISGTSMATPHVAGAVALMEQMKRHFDGDGWDTPNLAEREALTLTAEPLPGEGSSPNNDYGWGLVQLLPILALLENSDDASIIDVFSISDTEVRQGETTTLTFSVRNLGGAVATGAFYAELEDPDGSIQILADENVSLGLLDGASVSHAVTVGGSVMPGTYTFRGSFDYEWTNGSGEEKSASLTHEGNFSVLRVFIDMALDGLDETAAPGTLQTLSFTAASTGNEPASNVRIEFSIPTRYEFLPGTNFDPTDENTLYANPAPDRTIENTAFQRITLIWDVGDLAEGESFSFTSNLLPTLPDTYRFMSVAKYQDGAANEFGQNELYFQTVGLP